MKLKALSAGTLAVMAMSAGAAVDAPAVVSGHFVHDVAGGHAVLAGGETATHVAEFTYANSVVMCENVKFEGTAIAATTTSLTFAPVYNNCTGPNTPSIKSTINGCAYLLSSYSKASEPSPTGHATITIECPAGKAMIFVHEDNCEVRMPPQALKGVTYATTTSASGKHELTLTTTVPNVTTHRESGPCVLLGTNLSSTWSGSTTLRATDTAGNPVHLTAT